jgi:thiamine-phosphate pyrophosphorylase
VQIYALCDYQTLQSKNISLEEFAKLCNTLNVSLVQYRDKTSDITTQKHNLLKLKILLKIPVIINDKIDLLEYADGLHLGQEDLTALTKNKKEFWQQLNKQYPNKIFGLSTHNENEIKEANSFDLYYIGLGAYRSTTTKDISVVLGDSVSSLATLSLHKVAVIGGVKLDDTITNASYLVVGSGLFTN